MAYQNETIPTIEREFYNACLKLELIRNRENCDLIRCGRTDKGVHSTGNYISINLRTRDTSPYNYQEMINALYQLKTKWHVGIIDLWNDEEMNTTPTEKIREFMADGIHPTRKGYEFWWGPKFEEYILKFFNN